MEHISQVIQDTLTTKGLSPAPPLSESRKQEIRSRLRTMERYPLHPLLNLVLKDMRDLLTELERKEGEE